jgi:hypothetical protein
MFFIKGDAGGRNLTIVARSFAFREDRTDRRVSQKFPRDQGASCALPRKMHRNVREGVDARQRPARAKVGTPKVDSPIDLA